VNVLSPLESQGRISILRTRQANLQLRHPDAKLSGGTGSAAVTHFTIEPKGSVVRVGVNYLFNWGAPGRTGSGRSQILHLRSGQFLLEKFKPGRNAGFLLRFPQLKHLYPSI
jgi:hypothetical protein